MVAKAYHINSNLYHYAGNNPIKYTDPTGEVLETAWDIGCTLFDLGAAIYKSSIGDHSGWIDVGADLASVVIPGLPAGLTKLDDVARIANKIDDVKDSAKAIKNARQSAVRKAWKQEKEMVLNKGYGSREWTKSELRELKETGKVKGYQGHHINNVKDHPSMAGDPNNIEFLNKSEHLDAHNGNYRNKTEGPLIDRSGE